MTARRPGKSSAVDDFFDDTLLPPPVPGLVMPSGIIGHELTPEVSADHAPPVLPAGQAIPTAIPDRPSQTATPLPVSARKATLRFAPLELPLSMPPRSPVPATPISDEDTARNVTAQRTSEPSGPLSRLSLPVLPPPSVQSPAADLRYLAEAGVFLLRARRAEAGLRRRQQAERAALDRYLALHGQTRSRDAESMRAVEALFFAGSAGQPAVTPPGMLARLEARVRRLLDELRRSEARLGSELRERMTRTRRYQTELDGIDGQLPQVSAELLRRRHELASALTTIRREADERSHELGLLAVERQVVERASALCRRDAKATMASFLAAQSGQAAGRTALLLVGALLELAQPGARVGLLPTARTQPASPLLGLLGLESERARIVAATQALDRRALRRSLLFLLVMAITALLCAGIALWALTGS